MNEMNVAPGVLVEPVGEEVLVIVPRRTEAVRLSGHAVTVLRTIQAGREIDPNDSIVSELIGLGIIQAPGMSRRGLIKAGAVGAGAGVAIMAMPGVAAAASCQISFFVGVGASSENDALTDLWVFLDKPGTPDGLTSDLEIGHPATFTLLSGRVIGLEWMGLIFPDEDWSYGFSVDLSLIDPIPTSELEAVYAGTLRFSFNGCAYTATNAPDDD